MDQDFLVTWFVGIIVLALVGLREDFTDNTFGKDHEMNLVSLVRVYIAH